MTNINEKVRLHVHWGMKVIAILENIIFSWRAYQYWQTGDYFSAFIFLLFSLFGIWVFFLADTKIDVDQNGIQVTAPHGVYSMRWEEVLTVERNKFSTYFFADNNAIGYNLLLAGKGKQEFQEYINQIVDEWQFAEGRPEGISNSTLQKMLKKSKVRRRKFF